MIINTSSLSAPQERALKSIRNQSVSQGFQVIQACRTTGGGVSAQGMAFVQSSKSTSHLDTQARLESSVADLLDEIQEAPDNCKLSVMVHPSSTSIQDIHVSLNPFIGGDNDEFPVWFDARMEAFSDDPFLPLDTEQSSQDTSVQVSQKRSQESIIKAHLISMGGNEWRGGTHHRIYFNDLCEWYGLELNFFGTGNISSAKLGGEKLSNNRATRLRNQLDNARVWYDLSKQEFFCRGLDDYESELLLTSLNNKLNELFAS